MELNRIYHLDNREGMAQLPEKCANLIIADPPYFEVKGEFDFVWKSFDEYLQFMEGQAKAYKRILADNGTLFVYGHAKRIAYVQVIFDKYFNLENNLTWNKAEKDGLFGQTGSEVIRSFPPCTERLLMYSNEIQRTGLEEIKLDKSNFINLRDYFKGLQSFIGLSLKKINERLGHRKAEHCFYHSSTQWDLPTIETYHQLIEVFNIHEWEHFRRHESLSNEYKELMARYDGLIEGFESKRRPFNNQFKLNEVLNFRFQSSDYEHDTVKPEPLTRALILTCSRPNDLVVVPFAGSGTECAMAAKEGRRFVGFDTKQEYVEMATKRVKTILSQPNLFAA